MKLTVAILNSNSIVREPLKYTTERLDNRTLVGGKLSNGAFGGAAWDRIFDEKFDKLYQYVHTSQ